MRNLIVFTYMQQAPDRIDYADLCLESWKKWADRHDVDIMMLQDPIQNVKDMKPTWQRWHIFDILQNMYPAFVPYVKIALVDLDTLVHPNAPNFFNDILTEDVIGVVQDDIMVEWVQNSIDGYQDLFPAESLKWTEYFNCGFVVLPVKPALINLAKAIVGFYYSNQEELRTRQHETVRKGSDQTPVNYLTVQAGIKKVFLDKRWNFTHVHLRGALSDQGLKIIDKLAYIYHFNGFDKAERHKVMKTVWNKLSMI